jgi:MFS family permease
MTISEAASEQTGVAAVPALEAPTRRVTARWILLWSLANFMLSGLVYGAASVVGPQLAERVDPAGKVGMFALAGALTGLVALVCSPVFGALSDRTTARSGRRHPWILAGALGTGAVFAAQAFQTTVAGYLLTAVALGVAVAVLSTSLVAVVPDDVPVRQRATVSAWGGGVGGSLGLLVCISLVAVVVTGVTAGFVTMAVLVVLGVLPFALFTRGVPLPGELRTRFTWRALVGSLWVSPRQHPDFWWAMSGRFLFFLANGLFSGYLYFFLEDELHQADPAVGVLLLNTVYVIVAALASVPMGRLSDRRLRRKNLTIVSAALQAAACVTLAVSLTWTAALIAAVLLGLGFGVYMSVDQALVTEVLPEAARRGKDMGLINLAVTLAGLLAPALSGPVILHLGGYSTLFWLAAVVGVGSAVLVRPIRGVR